MDIETSDVLRLVMQFLKENGLTHSLTVLQEESQVALNTVDSKEKFVEDVIRGRWDLVLQQVQTFKLPQSVLIDLYEQMVFEMLESGEWDAARTILHNTDAMSSLRNAEPRRFLTMERMIQKETFEQRDAYGVASSKEQRRKDIGKSLAIEVQVVPAGRLTTLLQQSVKWQQFQGLLPPGTELDLFRGTAPVRLDEAETHPKRAGKHIKFGTKSRAESAIYTPDGQGLVTGSKDGFIEVWDYTTGRLRKDLKYQADDKLMMHADSVLCLSCSRDGEYLVSGSQDGQVKVWHIKSGRCLRKFEQAHSKGVSCVKFSADSTQLLTGSFDTTARIHGLKSGKTLKVFRGHKSFVNTAVYVSEGKRVLTGSSDGTIRLWDSKTADCIRSVAAPRAPDVSIGTELTVVSLIPDPRDSNQIFVCSRSESLALMSVTGQTIKLFEGEPKGRCEFVAMSLSPRGGWLYGLTMTGSLLCYHVESGELKHTIKASEKEPIGVAHHPHRNMLATYHMDARLNMWLA